MINECIEKEGPEEMTWFIHIISVEKVNAWE